MTRSLTIEYQRRLREPAAEKKKIHDLNVYLYLLSLSLSHLLYIPVWDHASIIRRGGKEQTSRFNRHQTQDGNAHNNSKKERGKAQQEKQRENI